MGWADGEIAAFDLETTGLDPRDDEIVQVAFVRVGVEGALLDGSWTSVVDPGFPIPPEATRVHGITDERARAEGIPAGDAAVAILDRLDALAAEGTPLVIYNAPFDLGFMHVRAARLGRRLPEVAVIDPLVIDRAADRFRRGSRTLESVARHYGCDPDGALHDARADAAVSVAVARAIAARFEEVGERTPRDLHRHQVGWYRAWAEGFADYLARRGRDASSVDPGWPVPHRVVSAARAG